MGSEHDADAGAAEEYNASLALNATYDDDDMGGDLNSHPAVLVIYRILLPIICACGILGIILTGEYSASYSQASTQHHTHR